MSDMGPEDSEISNNSDKPDLFSISDKPDLFSISDKPETTSSSHIPSYHVNHVYDIDSNSQGGQLSKRPKVNRSCCFNCGGSGHALRECSFPYNPRQISKNRAAFASRNEFKRYHVDLKEKMYPDLKPGVISDKLRKALGLEEDQLPMHIYRMRTLGYPPGWLLEAKLDSSGIEMFDIEGNRIPNADEEEGEIGSTTSTYDESKIISYPGFNEWPVPGTIDESKHYDAPEMKYMQSKEDFIKSLKKDESLQNSERKVHPEPKVLEGECDMETEEIEEDLRLLPEDDTCKFIPPLPDESPPPPPADNEGRIVGDGNVSKDEDEMASPVIEENLLSKLDDSTHGRVVSIELGTPVLKIHSSYDKLPPAEAFKKNISDVINFENLPDSTGAYEKLKDVLKGVRKRMSLIKETKLNATI